MRLIDADKLLQEIEFEYDLDYGETLIDPRDFADAVCDSPTVDAVPVVRCRECKNWEPYGSKAARKIGDPLERYGECEIWHGGHLESDFCSNGEKVEVKHET